MFIHHNSAQLYATEFGSGPRAIIAHDGWTGSWELWTEPGELDAIVPSDAGILASRIPHSHLHVVKGAGHVPTVTRPFEVAQVINQHFSQ